MKQRIDFFGMHLLLICFLFIIGKPVSYGQTFPITNAQAIKIFSDTLHIDSLKPENKQFKKYYPEVIRDSIYLNNATKKPIRAGIEWLSFQALPASFNYFIRKDPYSGISFKNWFDHLNINSWAWDDNAFATNQIAHPVHGNLYFNAFRSNNYSFYTSSLATFAGSFIWETAGETQNPSINDLVNTTFGGIILGEMTNRLSKNVLSRPTRNIAERQSKEVLAFFINPVNGLNRLLDARWGRIEKGAVADSSDVQAEFDIGVKRFDAKNGDVLFRGKNDLYARIRLIYSNDDIENKKPFDDFSVNLEVSSDDSSFVNNLNVYASIYGHRMFKNLTGNHLGIVSANYDFIHNEAFFFGSQSLNYNIVSQYNLPRRSQLKTILGAGPVLLAAIPDPYLLFGKSRNYNYSSGFDWRTSVELKIWNRLKISAGYIGGYFFTLSGDDSYYFTHSVSGEASLRFFKNFALNANSGYYNLHGHFKEFASFKKEYPFVRISLGYNVFF